MKKLLMVAVLAVFVLGNVACGGGGNPEDLANDMIKVTNDYTAALKKVSSKEDLITAMKAYGESMKAVNEKAMALMKKDPKAMASTKENKALTEKVQKAMQDMMAANMAENVTKLMSDPDVQKATAELQKAMMKK